MKSYLKMELKKMDLKRHIKGVLLIISGMLLFETIGFLQGLHTSGPDRYDPYLPRMMNLLVITSFTIYSSVFIGNLIIREYTNRTILILFSYPLNRRKIILFKLGLVCLFTMTCIFIGNLFCQAYIFLIDALFNVVTGTPDLTYFVECGVQTVFGTLMGGILPPLIFIAGMWKKSMSTTFISSVAVAAFFFEAMGILPPAIMLPVCAVTAVISFLGVKYILNHKTETLDSL